jgi:hypothetical protein
MSFDNKNNLIISDEILSEIDSTLEQLIRNTEIVSEIQLSDLHESELDAFQKTQESLLHHLVSMDHLFEMKRKSISKKNLRSAAYQIEEKFKRFNKLKTSVNLTIQRAEKKLAIFSKRRNKRMIHIYRT